MKTIMHAGSTSILCIWDRLMMACRLVTSRLQNAVCDGHRHNFTQSSSDRLWWSAKKTMPFVSGHVRVCSSTEPSKSPALYIYFGLEPASRGRKTTKVLYVPTMHRRLVVVIVKHLALSSTIPPPHPDPDPAPIQYYCICYLDSYS